MSVTKYFTIPGYSGNDENHWQSYWEREVPNCKRIEQDKWVDIDKDEWISRVQEVLYNENLDDVVLIGHSFGVATILHWYKKFGHKIKGALLVAPTDSENLPEVLEAKGFDPMPLEKLPFPTIIVESQDDKWIPVARAKEFAKAWGSEFVDVGNLGHINSDSNLGSWLEGREILKRL